MKWYGVVILGFSVACASGAPPREYRQGVPVVPSAPPFSPVTRAPITVGQPGYVGPLEGLPRSPYGRVLPETPGTRKEPGLWAAEVPKASDSDDGDPAVILIAAPLAPPNASTHELMRISQCALGARDLFAHSLGNLSYEASALSIKQLKQEGRCIVARVYRVCVEAVIADETAINKQRKKEGREDLPSLARIGDLAKRFEHKECPFPDLPTAELRMSDRAERALNMTLRLLRSRYQRVVKEGK